MNLSQVPSTKINLVAELETENALKAILRIHALRKPGVSVPVAVLCAALALDEDGLQTLLAGIAMDDGQDCPVGLVVEEEGQNDVIVAAELSLPGQDDLLEELSK